MVGEADAWWRGRSAKRSGGAAPSSTVTSPTLVSTSVTSSALLVGSASAWRFERACFFFFLSFTFWLALTIPHSFWRGTQQTLLLYIMYFSIDKANAQSTLLVRTMHIVCCGASLDVLMGFGASRTPHQSQRLLLLTAVRAYCLQSASSSQEITMRRIVSGRG